MSIISGIVVAIITWLMIGFVVFMYMESRILKTIAEKIKMDIDDDAFLDEYLNRVHKHDVLTEYRTAKDIPISTIVIACFDLIVKWPYVLANLQHQIDIATYVCDEPKVRQPRSII